MIANIYDSMNTVSRGGSRILERGKAYHRGENVKISDIHDLLNYLRSKVETAVVEEWLLLFL